MATHRTEFAVDASDEQVWAVLIDFESYADWNPSLPSISGDLREGSTVSLTLALPGRPSLNVKAVLLEVAPNRGLIWRGHLGADRLFTGYREFALHPLAENKVRVTHVEDLQGWLAPVFEALMGRSVQRHHDTFNESLKSRAEAIAAQAAYDWRRPLHDFLFEIAERAWAASAFRSGVVGYEVSGPIYREDVEEPIEPRTQMTLIVPGEDGELPRVDSVP